MNEKMLDPGRVHKVIDLLVVSIHIDRHVLDVMDRLDEDFAEINILTKQIFKQLNSNKHALNEKALSDQDLPSEDVIDHLAKVSLHNKKIAAEDNDGESQLKRLCAFCEHSLAFYETIVETSIEEAVKLIAQELALSTLDRITTLKLAFDS